MAEFNHPGVYVTEEPTAPTIRGSGITTGALVGLSEKGPVDTLQLITSFTQFKTIFGPHFKLSGSYTYLAFAAEAFFREGGRSCYIVRIAPTDATASSADLDEYDLSTSAGTIDAQSVGDWGNLLSVRVEKRAPMVVQTAITDEATSQIEVDDVSGLETGDLIYINSTGQALDNPLQVVYAIDTSGANPVIETHEALAFTPSPITTGVPANSTVHVATRHRLRTSLVNDVDTSATVSYIDVTAGSALDLVPGQVVVCVGDDSVSPTAARCAVYGVVDSVVQTTGYDRINFVSGSATDGTATTIEANGNDTVVSVEFDLDVFENNVLVESHRRLSLSRTNARDFIGGGDSGVSPETSFTDGRLYGDLNESTRVTVTTLATSNAVSNAKTLVESTPLTNSKVVLSGGVDGTNDTTQVPASKYTTAIDLLNDADAVSLVAAPDAAGNTAVQAHLADHAEASTNRFAIIDADLSNSQGSSAVSDVMSWRLNTLNKNTSYAGLYWPWLIVRDPEQSSVTTPDPGAFSLGFGTLTVKVPPSGAVMGAIVNTILVRGPHKAPANITLRGVFDVTKRISDNDHDLLNPIGVNAIRNFSGLGILIDGSRTLSAITNGFHYVSTRIFTNFVKRSLKEGNRFAVQEPNDPRLWSILEQVNTQFFRALWNQGMLFPSNDIDRAFFVRSDAETTTEADRKNGRVNVLVGFNPPYPAEFVVFRVSLYDGQSSITEIVTGNRTNGGVGF